jgi:hypothetical protein
MAMRRAIFTPAALCVLADGAEETDPASAATVVVAVTFPERADAEAFATAVDLAGLHPAPRLQLVRGRRGASKRQPLVPLFPAGKGWPAMSVAERFRRT